MKTSILLRSVLVASFLFFAAASFGIDVPKPLAIDIDDLGWKEGWDLHESGGPYRLGLPRGRMMGLEDYEVVVDIGKAAGVRIKSLFIMSEFDRSNICAAYPTTNEHGSDWDNSALVSDGDFVIMDYFFGIAERWANRLLLRRTRICLHRIAQASKEEIYPDLQNGNIGYAHLRLERRHL